MVSDPNKPLLRLKPNQSKDRPVGKPRRVPLPEAFLRERQTRTFSPKFNRLSELLARDPSGLELRADPTALAPERLLVFEVRGSISSFAEAVSRLPGLELIDEDELEGDEQDDAPVLYLMVPDIRALRNLESLWQRWLRGELQYGEMPWRDVFERLRDLRPWGPQDRVQKNDASILQEEIKGRSDEEFVRLEIELVFRDAEAISQSREQEIARAVQEQGGRVISKTRIEDIAYHALLVDLRVTEVRRIFERSEDSIVAVEGVMYVRPQSIVSSVDVSEAVDGAEPPTAPVLGDPILLLLDGVPIAGHKLLADYLVVDDPFDLEAKTPVADRVHGTAMASLILHGDRNQSEPPLPRRIHVVPVLGAKDAFPEDRLIVDIIYSAIVMMREGPEATAPGVVIVNLSLGNARRRFQGQLSAWARLLDRLAYRYGLLFIVSAGNCLDTFGIKPYSTRAMFEGADQEGRAQETLRAIGAIIADRRLLSPAETVNGLTVGAYNDDAVSAADRSRAINSVDPYGQRLMANPSSALGPGCARSVKPDIMLAGGRERLAVVRNHSHIDVRPAAPGIFAGLRVAGPPSSGRENTESFTIGTSAAAALASRTAHRIHDALERAYGVEFLDLPQINRALVLKALLAHTAKWPDETADFIRQIIGPPDAKLHVRQKDNIRRFLGFGIIRPDDAVACTEDRATLWATGILQPNKVTAINVPVPIVMSGQARPHSLAATLAWFTPIAPGRKNYRSVRLRLVEPNNLEALGLRARGNQPDGNQTNRGTLFMRSWEGDRAPVVAANSVVPLTVQRDPDRGIAADVNIPFGVAISLAMPGLIGVYEQVRQRLAVDVLVKA